MDIKIGKTLSTLVGNIDYYRNHDHPILTKPHF